MPSATTVISPLFWFYIAVQAGWLFWAVMNFIRRNDELPLVVAVFLAYCGSYRFLGAALGYYDWINLQPYGLAVSIDFNSAGMALGVLAFGQSVLLISYRMWQNKILVVQEQGLPGIVVSRLRNLLVFLTVVGLPIVLWAKYQFARLEATGQAGAFSGTAYVQQLPFVLVALALFLFLVWRFGILRGFFEKSVALILLLVIGYLTFGTSGRFLFLGWIIGGSYIVSTLWFGLKRIPVLLAGAVIAMALFGVAGAMRDTSETDTIAAGIERTKQASDANMLDGLTFLMQVYPEMLPYEYGMGHIEILERPIPRKLWPGKPAGGYMNKLGLFNAGSSVEIGISPTLFGSFYQEGGVAGVFIFSIIYGWVMARMVRYSMELRPLFGVMIRAGLIAGLIPLLRGGDLPGIYAWLGMAFWPMLFFMWWNRDYLRPGVANPPLKTSRRQRKQKQPQDQSPQALAPFSVTSSPEERESLKTNAEKLPGEI